MILVGFMIVGVFFEILKFQCKFFIFMVITMKKYCCLIFFSQNFSDKVIIRFI